MKTYLGDGLYVDTRGDQLVLTAENGRYATDTVYLEPEVFAALLRYHEGLMDEQAQDMALDEGGGLVLRPEDLDPLQEVDE